MRARNEFIIFAIVIPILAWLSTDPDIGLLKNLPFGGALINYLIIAVNTLVGVVLLHFVRKGLHDYDAADFEKLGIKALGSATGAGLYALAIAVMCLAYAVVIGAVLGS